MSSVDQHDTGIAFLERLLSTAERSPDRVRAVSAPPDYDELHTADSIERFQVRMAAAERAGAVSIRRGKRERRHLIERITVTDPVALARHLGRVPSVVAARENRNKLQALVADSEDWIHSLLGDIEMKWARGESAFRLRPGDMDLAAEFLTLLVAISRDQARGMDARTFSLRATGDTKAFDRHMARLATVLGARYGEPRPSALWRRVGLDRYGHPVYLCGTVMVEDEAGVLANGKASPFASIHPETLPLLRVSARPAAILTIENFASFNRQVREMKDNTLVVYTGGFPAAGVVDVLTTLLNMIDRNVPFFHWGDIDPGGVRIFRFLEESLPRSPLPHLMDRWLAETQGRPAAPDKTLASIASTSSAVSQLAGWLAHGEAIRHLEQETLDPRPLAQKP